MTSSAGTRLVEQRARDVIERRPRVRAWGGWKTNQAYDFVPGGWVRLEEVGPLDLEEASVVLHYELRFYREAT